MIKECQFRLETRIVYVVSNLYAFGELHFVHLSCKGMVYD